MAEPLADQPSSTKAIRSAGGQAPLFEVDQRTGSVYTFIMATSTLSTSPPGRVYVNEPWLSIRWDGVNQHVLSEWKAFANSAELRADLLKGIPAIRDNNAVSYVSDSRKIKVVIHSDQAWIKDTWRPLAVAAGLKRIAFVTAAKGLGKLTIEDVARLLDDDGLQSRTFDSMAAARKWVSEARASG